MNTKQKLMTTNQIEFSEEAKNLIKRTVAEGLTDLEFQMFLHQAQRTGLDPMARQIYAIKRAGKTVIQASIDGLRLIAQRDPNYAGQDEPIFEHDEKKLLVSKVSVYKFSPNGQRYPAAVGVAYFEEYCPMYDGKPSAMWAKMPHVMLAKVAEALALRKAFPQELSGIYTTEEMDQSATPVLPVVTPELAQVDLKEEKAMDNWAKIKSLETDIKDNMEVACTCGTTGRYHKADCPKHIII